MEKYMKGKLLLGLLFVSSSCLAQLRSASDFPLLQPLPPVVSYDPPSSQMETGTQVPEQKYSFWDYTQPQKSFGKTFKSPALIFPALALLGLNAADILKSTGCREKNELGLVKPQNEMWKEDGAADAAILAFAFFMDRGHIRFIPQGMIGYGIFVHTRGLINAINARCN